MAYYLGLDIGTTNSKGLLVDPLGNVIFSASRTTRLDNPDLEGWAQYNPDRIFDISIEIIRDIVRSIDNPKEIRSIAISSMGETGVPIDDKGDWVYPAIAWFDTRTEYYTSWIEENIGAERIYTITGLPLSSSYGATKLIWLKDHEPEVFHRSKRWLPIGDYVGFRLSNVQATDRTQAWRTMVYDINELKWSGDLISALNIDPGVMIEVLTSGTPIGRISRETANMTGLSPDCIYVTGGMDVVIGMIAVGAINTGVLLDMIGTSEILITSLKKPKITQAGMNASLDVGPHAIDDLYLAFGSMTASGALVDWFARLFSGKEEPEEIRKTLLDLTNSAEQIDEVSNWIHVLPHFRGSRTPYSDNQSKGVIAGLDLSTGRGEIFLGLLASLSWESRLIIDELSKLSGQDFNEIWVAGGASSNKLWAAIKADIFENEILIPEITNISAYGASICAAVGVGDFVSFKDACEQMAIQRVECPPGNSILKGRSHQFGIEFKAIYPAFKKVKFQEEDI